MGSRMAKQKASQERREELWGERATASQRAASSPLPSKEKPKPASHFPALPAEGSIETPTRLRGSRAAGPTLLLAPTFQATPPGALSAVCGLPENEQTELALSRACAEACRGVSPQAVS
ncbi:hypothetical protein TREES_T100016105 [Tupaia chinensis]|uniref:Uncharacterized protein n=1 Tax=Tupaia chinensis TaxID=246437 RepID=L9KF97_TUPCH|nr:hypothetical protein TREES_T100016105 [Tupaia chinensis]